MVGPARPRRNFFPRAMFLLPLDVRLDELVALRVFYLLHGRRDLLRGENEPAHPRRAEPLTRTVNGTGHTGTSEFCATSI